MTVPFELKRIAHLLVKQGHLAEAKEKLLEGYKLGPDDADILLGLGVVHARLGGNIEAEKWLTRLTELTPDNPGAYIHLANSQNQLEKYDEAISNYQIAISLNSNIFEGHYYLAGLLMSLRRLEDAVFHYNFAVKLQPQNANCHANLGQAYELLHRLDDAQRCADEAFRLNRGHFGAQMLAGRLHKRNKRYEEAEAMFRAVLGSTADQSLIATAWAEMGHVLDKLDHYDEAYDAFTAGKAIRSGLIANLSVDKQEYQRRIAENIRCFTEERISHWPEISVTDNRPAPAFLVGFPRSGTTLSEQIINTHADIVTTDEKSLLKKVIDDIPLLLHIDDPYPDLVDQLDSCQINVLRESYWNNAAAEIEDLADNSFLLDKLPLNLVDLGFITRIFPDSKVLVAIRDPRATCLSCYMQDFNLNPAMLNFLSMDTTVSFYRDVMGLWLHYRNTLPVQWHQYRYEDLVDDFDGTTRAMFEFLGMDYPANTAEFHEVAKSHFIITPSYQDVTTPIYSRSKERWKHYEKHLSPYTAELETFLEEFGYRS